MAQKHVVKFSSIINYFNDELKLVERGENAVESGDVISMSYKDDVQIISGNVHASMRNKKYHVNIYLNKEGNIMKSDCECPRGQVICHHVAALAIYAHYNISVTDKSCSWAAPKKKKVADNIKTMEDLYPLKKKVVVSKRNVTEDDVEKLRKKLEMFSGAVGFTWLINPDIPVEEDNYLLPAIADIIFSDSFRTVSNKRQYLEEMAEVTQEIIDRVAEVTVGQSSNPMWLIYRNMKLTASNFGVVLNACRRNKYPPSLFKRLTGTYNLDGIKAIQWGKAHEKDALNSFTMSTNLCVRPTGLHLHPCGYLGATPDGLVNENSIVEIKCPFKFRNVDLSEALKLDKTYICKYDSDNAQFVLNKNHEYYHQIQGQLYILNKDMCYLIVWTPAALVIMEVEKDEDWSENINILQNFYHEQYIPHVLQ